MSTNKTKIYPESGVELRPFTAKYYDTVLNVATLGLYTGFIHRSIKAMAIQPKDKILDFGCGSGRNACLMAKYLDNEGKIIGLDISALMESQFNKQCARYPHINFIRQRIDLPFDLSEQYDKLFISFVLHGFPHRIRQNILHNIDNHLKPGGILFLLDYAEFNPYVMPLFYRSIFKTIECPYAFDFIARDWKQILTKHNFGNFEEFYFFRNYVRLLQARKNDPSVLSGRNKGTEDP